ncbi:MAG: aromatic amino acid transport family protein [Chlamydiales bacterium]
MVQDQTITNKQTTIPWGETISAMFLIGGCCIGGGMLALPVTTGLSGLLPSLVMMMVTWLAMTATGLLLIEASLWFQEEVHFVSITQSLLGKWGKIICWLLYLFVSYASLMAYTSGGGVHVLQLIQSVSGWAMSKPLACIIFFTVFGIIIDLGANVVGRMNTVLFTAMIFSYVGMVGLGISEIDPSLFYFRNWSVSFLAVPLLLTSFSYQSLAPSLTPYLKRNKPALRIALIGGTTIALVVYIIWQLLILGIVPSTGQNSLLTALMQDEPATIHLNRIVNSKWMVPFTNFFAFFALVTSFLGMGLGLFDFLADGLKIQKKGLGKVFLGTLIALPVLTFAIFFERVFYTAMDLSGGFGDTILSGLLPILIVWSGRYIKGIEEERFLPGGKFMLILLGLFFALSLISEICVQIGLAPSLYDVREANLL